MGIGTSRQAIPALDLAYVALLIPIHFEKKKKKGGTLLSCLRPPSALSLLHLAARRGMGLFFFAFSNEDWLRGDRSLSFRAVWVI